jgi:broad specificity phosphatase PhoE
MFLLFVRHGESEGNLAGLMQGRGDFPLSERGRAQAQRLGAWLAEHGVGWDAAYVSPLGRARQTAEIVVAAAGGPEPEVEPDLAEVTVGSLEGLNREQIAERHPDFLTREITKLGDFGAYGGETYDGIQERVARLTKKLFERHREAGDRVLLVAHGGLGFHLLKSLVCEPVPPVCILRLGNCTASLVRLRERRGVFFGELVWHVPVELMGGVDERDVGALFR